jgi:hypothetical protein
MRLNTPAEPVCICSNRVAFAEVVIAVSMCSVLLSFAVPRLTHLPNEVRATEVETLSIKLRSAAAALHDQYVDSGAKITQTTWEGRQVLLDHGYPDLGAHGIQSVVIDPSEFTVSTDLTSVTYYKVGAPVMGECAVIYRIAPGTQVAASTAVVTRGC